MRAATMLAALVLCMWSGSAAADDCTAIGAVVGGECQVSQFVTASGTLSIARPLHILAMGQIRVPPAATGQPPSSLSLNVTGPLTVDAPLPALPGGGAIIGDVQDAGAIAATLIIVASGDIALTGDPTRGASITSNANPTDCAGNGRAGKVSVTSTGGSLVAGLNTQITANAQCPGGEVTISVPSGNISIDGSVSASAGYSGSGNLTISKGGPVTIAAGCQLTLGPDSSVRSSGVKYGADLVHLESGCDTLIQGEVRSEGGITYPGLLLGESLPNKCVADGRTNKATSFPTGFVPSAWQPTGCIEIWSGGTITIQSKSSGALIAESGNAAAGQNGLCCTWIDVFARSDIAVTGPGPVGSPSFYALNARQYASHAPAGLVTVKSINGKVTATGGGFITASGRADTTEGGGTIWVEAGGPTSLPPNSTTWDPASNVDLNATWVQARASVASPPGTIRIKSYNGDITGSSGGLLDSRTDSGGSVTLTIQGCRLPEYFTDWNSTQILPPTLNLAPVCGGTPTLPPPAVLPKRAPLVMMVGGIFQFDFNPHPATGTVQDIVSGAVIQTVPQSTTTHPAVTVTYFDSTGTQLGGAPVNPGIYSVRGDFPGDSIYAAATGFAQIQIISGTVELSVTGNTCVYSGDPCPASVSGSIGGTPAVPTVTYNGSTTVPVNAGTYSVVANLAGKTATATVTITPLTPTITFTGDGTFVFDASAHKVTAIVKGAKDVVLTTLSYTGTNTTAFGYTPSIGTLAGPFNVCATTSCDSFNSTLGLGGYRISASYPGLSPNYLATAAQTTVVITKATPTVFVGSFTLVYGQSYSYNSSNAYVLGVGTPPEQLGAPTLAYKDSTGALLPSPPTLPGVYTVVGTYSGTNTNYVPATGPGSVTVTGSGSVTINPLVATISLPSPVYTYTGAPQGVTATVTGSGIFSGTTATVTYFGTAGSTTAPTNVAVYPTQATFARTGYVADPVSGTITINPATPTFTLTGGTFTYDGQPHGATPGTVSGVSGQILAQALITYCPGVVTTPCASPLPTAPVDVGTYTAFAVAGGGVNYTTVTKTATITINKATATITLTGGTYVYDGNPHPAIGSVTGSGVPAGTTPTVTYTLNGVATGTPVIVGVYAAMASLPAALATNYTAAPATATVTITPLTAVITVTGGTYFYDGQPHPATGTVAGTGIPTGTSPIITYILNGAPTGTPVQVGIYTATASLPPALATGYTATPTMATVTIKARSCTPTTNGGFVFTTIAYPLAGVATTAYGISSTGQITGTFVDTTSTSSGFWLSSPVGSFSPPIAVPASTGTLSTVVYGLNTPGQIVGTYVDGSGQSHGFLLTGSTGGVGGTLTPIDAPTALGATQTAVYGINDSGQIVGAYIDGAGKSHGFALSHITFAPTTGLPDLTTATFTPIYAPTLGATETAVYGINANGQVVGAYVDGSGKTHGLSVMFASADVSNLSGATFATIDAPSAVATRVFGIDDAGRVVGSYDDSAGIKHGFLFAGGTVTTLDAGECGTEAHGINNAGQIIGGYVSADGPRGFVTNVQLSESTRMCQAVNGASMFVGTRVVTKLPSGNVRVTYTQSRDVADNTYGVNAAVGYTKGHKFGDLTGGDMAEFRFTNGDGTVVLDFNVDYISGTKQYPSGYGTLGVSGGDGKMLKGSVSNITFLDTSLSADLDQSAAFYGFIVDSPAPESSFPTWEYQSVYTVEVSATVFGTSGFGGVTIPVVHNSPPKTGVPDPLNPVPCADTSGTGSFTTYTQGGWGASPSGSNPAALLAAKFSTVYPGGSVAVGGGKLITFTSASAIQAFLPQGGSPGVLTATATNPTSTSAKVFAGQVLALRLSVDFSNAGITRAGLANLKVASGRLAGYTVGQVLSLANAVLGGNTGALPSGLSVSGLNGIVDAINNNFDNGTTNNHYLQ